MQVMPNAPGASAPASAPHARPADPMHAAQIEREAARMVSKSRADLVMSQPFFGALALRLRVVPDWSVPSFAVDGTSLFYNPGFAHGLPFRQLVGIIAHEVMHCALAHHARQGDREDRQWNEACDFAINGILKHAGFELPDDVLYDPGLDGKPAEEIYRIRYRKPDQGGGGGGGGGQGGAGGNAPPQGGGQPDKNGQNQGQGQGQGKPPLSTGTVQAPPGATQSEASRTEQENEWKAAAAQAAQAAKQAGKLPAGLEELIEQSRQPKVDWREVLRDFVKATAKNDYSWSRPNRRFVAQGLYLPSAYSEKVGKIGVVVDTSASVSRDELEAFRGELESVFAEVKPEAIRVIQCDAKVWADDTLDPDFDEMKFNVKGRGGTKMEPAFERIVEDADEYECLICMSDMELFSWPDDPGMPVLWVSTGSEGAKTPPFGDVIVLDLAGKDRK
jgi:predicted metal-dependent peptidase